MSKLLRYSSRLQATLLALGVVVVDQISKAWAEQSLPVGVFRPWIPGLLAHQLVYNRGAAFSMLSQAQPLLALISAVVVTGVSYWLWRQHQLRHWQSLAIGLLLGGAAGNGLDRWSHGAVVDFLALVPIDFPVFNVADVAINLAVLALAIDVWSNRTRRDD